MPAPLPHECKRLDCPDSVIRRFEGMCRSQVRELWAPGFDADDLLQEARIGVCKAHRDFNPGSGATFAGFAWNCIRRQLITAIKFANRDKHIHLNDAISLHLTTVEGESADLGEILPAPSAHEPHEKLIVKEQLDRHLSIMRTASDLEREALARSLNGASYVGDKRIDNALQRVRKKLAAAA